MAKNSTSYDELKNLSTEIHTLHSILSLLHWDQEIYMPAGSISSRSAQIAELSNLIHEKKTGRKYKNALEKLVSLSTGKIKIKGLSKEQRVSIREWHRDFMKMDRLPASFVKEYSQVTSQAGPIWAEAKKQNNFKLFAPFLEQIVSLARKKAKLLGFEDHPYDALLQMYEPCMSTKKVEEVFSKLKKELKTLLEKISSKKSPENRFLFKKVSDEKQLELAREFLKILPIDPTYSRLDLSAHPFSIALHPEDSRITTRILPHHFMSNLFSVFHEVGHSLYEMALPSKHFGTPLCEAVSLSIHESQSRWWETLIGRSLPFWEAFYPLLQKILPSFKKISLEKFYRAVHAVSPSLIRVEADEVTYCLHVILRFEIEQELIKGTLAVKDLPKAWNEKMKDLFGIVPSTDREGCLQDVHWSLGDFGYFPTYALGNLFAAQFFEAFEKEHKDWKTRVSQKDLTFIREWLKNKIHKWGKFYNAEELAIKVTKEPLSEKAYCKYLKKKYSILYKF